MLHRHSPAPIQAKAHTGKATSMRTHPIAPPQQRPRCPNGIAQGRGRCWHTNTLPGSCSFHAAGSKTAWHPRGAVQHVLDSSACIARPHPQQRELLSSSAKLALEQPPAKQRQCQHAALKKSRPARAIADDTHHNPNKHSGSHNRRGGILQHGWQQICHWVSHPQGDLSAPVCAVVHSPGCRIPPGHTRTMKSSPVTTQLGCGLQTIESCQHPQLAACQGDGGSGTDADPPMRSIAATVVAVVAVGFALWGGGAQPAAAHIPIDQRMQGPTYFIPPEANLGLKPGVVDRNLRRASPPNYEDRSYYQPMSQAVASGNGVSSTASRAKDALARLQAAHKAVDAGQYEQALAEYSYIVNNYEELALASYARTGQALMLYQVGRVSDALLALEDQEVLVRGTAEVHAALAALLWVERPNLAFRAEQQWEVAREFDTRYSDLTWVQQSKHWPPRVIGALQRFLTLTR